MDGMLDGMPLDLLNRWMEYEQINPFGEYRADVRSAIIADVISVVFGEQKRSRLREFMAIRAMAGKRKARQSWRSMKIEVMRFVTDMDEFVAEREHAGRC